MAGLIDKTLEKQYRIEQLCGSPREKPSLIVCVPTAAARALPVDDIAVGAAPSRYKKILLRPAGRVSA